MITAVDTNVLLDIFGADPKFGELSANALRRAMHEGALAACELVWAEAGAAFGSVESFRGAMDDLGIAFSSITQETALVAGQAWSAYRSAGGKRERVAADFLIGAHAKMQCDRLLTRDKGFYKTYFKSIRVLDPSTALR